MIRLWPKIKQTLQTQLTIRLMMIAVISTTISSLVFSVYEYNTAESSETLRLQSIADILAPNLTASLIFDDKDTANELIQPLNDQPSIVEVTVHDSNGDIFVAQTNIELPQQSQIKLKQISAPLVMEGTYYGELIIQADDSLIDQHVQFFVIFISIILGITLFISFGVSVAVSRHFTTPISRLAFTANQVTQSNNYSLRAEHSREDEIGDLTRCFNSMLATIEQRDQTLEWQVSKRTKQLKVANIRLKDQAYKDILCDLPNRRYLIELMSELINDFIDHTFTLMFIDLDGFKEVNDTMGHDAGDLLIISAANRIKASLRSKDTLARLGGDEFTLLVNETCDRTAISHIAEKTREALSMPFEILGEEVNITASIGICSYPTSGTTVEAIMKKADLAMYAAKDAGRNCYRFFEQPMLDKMQLKRRMLYDLRTAIENDEFELFFQPIVNIRNGRIEKAEALIRWNHPEKGLVSPDDFIPHAEDNGLVNNIGCWITDQAIAAAKRFRQVYDPNFTISINASPVQFRKDSLWFDDLIYKLKRANLGKHAIAVEITENTLMENDQSALDKVFALNKMGIEIAIDDFGVGYSSLSYLQKLDVDIIKIDRSFVSQLNQDIASNTLCKTMVSMANNLNIKVVAEGVEEHQQLALLAQYGCEYGQGFLFSSPLNMDRFEELLSSDTSPSFRYNI
ncbi:EAL domain-containing protein [Vibrio sp. WJH972]